MNPATHTPATPGPWTSHKAVDAAGFYIRGHDAEGTSYPLALTMTRATPQEANARLLASAPDLLQALKIAAAAFDYTVAALAKGQTVSTSSLQNCAASARQAIARAEGRT